MRVKVATDPQLLRLARSTVESRRPVCGACGMRCPHRDEARDHFFDAYGHRRPDNGEPCEGGWRKTEPIAPARRPPPKPAPSFPAPQHGRCTVQLVLFDVPGIAEPAKRRQRKRIRVTRQEGVARRQGPAVLPLWPDGMDWTDRILGAQSAQPDHGK